MTWTSACSIRPPPSSKLPAVPRPSVCVHGAGVAMPKILDDNALRRLIEAARGCEEVDVIERAAMREYLLERPSARNGTGLWRSARRLPARTIGGGAARGVLRGRAPGCPRTTTPGRR